MLIVPTLKIAGLGAGTFIIILMIVIGIIISLVGYQTNKPAVFIAIGVILPGLFIIIFAAVPKGGQPERSDDDIDPMWSKRVGITTLLSVFAAVGLVMLLVHYVMAPVKASRLR